MYDQYVRQLRSIDPDERREAIICLADSDDPRMIEHLRFSAQNDPVPALRALAEKAQQHVQRKQWRNLNTPQPTPSSRPTTTRGVTSDPAAQARSHLNNAYSHRNNGNKPAAIVSLVQALELDPSIGDDPDTKELASDITNQPFDVAISWLMEKKQLHDKKLAKARKDDSFGSTMTRLGIEVLLTVIFIMAIVYISFQFYSTDQALAARLQAAASQSSIGGQIYRQIAASSTSTTRIIVATGVVAITYLVSSFITMSLMYLGGVLLGGTGSIEKFIEGQFRVTTVLWGVLFLLFLVLAVTQNSSASIKSGIQAAFSPIVLMSFLGTIGVSSYYAARTLEVHWFKGFLSVLSPSFVIWGFICLGNVLTYVMALIGNRMS